MLNQHAYVLKAVFLAYICSKSTLLTMTPYLGQPLLPNMLPDISCSMPFSFPKVLKLYLYFQKLSGGIFGDYDLMFY